MKTNWCVACGKEDDLHHHHLVPKAAGGEDKEDNIITLCSKHHAAVHGSFKAWNTSELTKIGIAKKRAKGLSTGTTKFGFKVVDGRVVECPKEQKVLALIKKLNDNNMSSRAIASHLKGLGIPNRSGNVNWEHTGILRLVKRF